MFHKIFSGDNALFRYTAKVFDGLLLSVLWALVCLPVFTVGPATAALYFTVVHCLRGGETATLTFFFRSFRENFKVGVLAGLLLTALWAVLLWGYVWLAAAAQVDPAGFVMFVAYYLALLLPAGLTCFALATLGRFTFGVGGLLKTALQLTLGHLPSALVAALVTVQAVTLTARLWFPIAFAPAVTALVWSLFFERVYAPFLPANDPES